MQNTNIPTTDQVRELEQCAQDFNYWCELYVQTVHPKKGLVSFSPYPYHRRLITLLKDRRFVLVPKFRQGGFTTQALAYAVWKALFHGQSCLWIADSDRMAVHCCHLARRILDGLPDWMTVKLTRNNDHEMSFSNDGNIWFTSRMGFCGRVIELIVIDEAAYINNCKEVWQACLPMLKCNCEVLALSTGKKLKRGEVNWFHQTLQDAKEGKNNFAVFDVKWHEHPDYNNEEWVDLMRTNLGDLGWRIEVEAEFVVEDEPAPARRHEVWKIIDRDIAEPVLIEREAAPMRVTVKEEPYLLPGIEMLQETIDLTKTPCPKPGEVHIKGVPPVKDTHPDFPEELDMNVEEVWKNITKVMPEVQVASPQKPDPFDYNSVNVEVLRMAGVYNNEGALPLASHSREKLLEEIKRGLPAQLQIDLNGDALRVNTVPTKINARAIDLALSGLAELVGDNRAVDQVGRIVRRKLQRLF